MEHPQEVIRMLFIAIILIFSIVIIYNLMQDICATNEYKTLNLKYNVIASKILYSSECYALQDSYELDETKRYQVHAGILDSSKFEKGRLENCIGNGQSKVTFYYLDSKGGAFVDETSCEGEDANRKMLVSIKDGSEFRPGLAEIKVCVEKEEIEKIC